MSILKSTGLVPAPTARSLATHFAGSQYMTWLSLMAVRTSTAGYGCGAMFVYGQ